MPKAKRPRGANILWSQHETRFCRLAGLRGFFLNSQFFVSTSPLPGLQRSGTAAAVPQGGNSNFVECENGPQRQETSPESKNVLVV